MRNLGLAAFLIFVFSAIPKRISMSDVMSISYLGDPTLPRGMRNNNPGNIEQGPSAWRGKIPLSENTDGRFEQFTNYVWGVRAMIRLIRDTYMKRDGLVTVRQILNKYAPSFENPTQAYINNVAQKVGVLPDDPLSTDKATMERLIQAIGDFENGVTDSIPTFIFNAAWQESLS